MSVFREAFRPLRRVWFYSKWKAAIAWCRIAHRGHWIRVWDGIDRLTTVRCARCGRTWTQYWRI